VKDKNYNMIKVKQARLAVGTTKTLFEGQESGIAILGFDDRNRFTTCEGGALAEISGKGILNNRISAHIMTCLESIGLPTHFLKSLNMREQKVKLVDPLPFIVRVRNIAAGSIVDRLELDEGTILPRPILEFFFKKDSRQYSLISDDHILAFQWADPYELEEIVTMAYRANDYMNGMFSAVGIRLVDFSIEFGRLWGNNGELYLMVMDEISPDTCRLWDVKTNMPFHVNAGDTHESEVIARYQEVAVRLGLIPREKLVKGDNFNEKMAADLDDIENILANNKDRKIRSLTRIQPRKGSQPRG